MLDSVDIDSPQAATVFTNARQRKIVLALVAKEWSLSDLARATETPLNLLHHHIRKFLRLGLVTIVREQPRAGSPIRFYRAAARTFFVPAEWMATTPGAELTRRLRDLLDHSLLATLKGVAYSHDGVHPQMHLIKDSGPRTVTAEVWLDLRLSREDAAKLAGELRTVMKTFEARSTAGSERYIIHAAIAPA